MPTRRLRRTRSTTARRTTRRAPRRCSRSRGQMKTDLAARQSGRSALHRRHRRRAGPARIAILRAVPLYPLDKTLADINVDDNLPMWGRTKDVIVIGLGASDLDDYLARRRRRTGGRALMPGCRAGKGLLLPLGPLQLREGRRARARHRRRARLHRQAAGIRQSRRRTSTRRTIYHSPSDEVKPDWDMTGLAEQAKLLMAVGYRIAQAEQVPGVEAGQRVQSHQRENSQVGRTGFGPPATRRTGRSVGRETRLGSAAYIDGPAVHRALDR